MPAVRRGAGTRSARRDLSPDFDFYELRHAFATALAQLPEVRPADIANQMGHADGGQLAARLYVHVDDAASRDRILKGWAEQGHRDDTRQAISAGSEENVVRLGKPPAVA